MGKDESLGKFFYHINRNEQKSNLKTLIWQLLHLILVERK